MAESHQPSSPRRLIRIDPFRVRRRVRNLIFDYALINAILGLNPVPGLALPVAVLVLCVLFKMMRTIARMWGYPQQQDLLARIGNLFGGIGAVAIASMAWLTFFGIGIVVPVVRGLAYSAAFFTLTWMIGESTNSYCAVGQRRAKPSSPSQVNL